MTPTRLIAQRLGPGVLATAAMTASTSAQHRWRRDLDHPVDYDASDHVVTAVETVVRRPARGRTEQRVYFALAHWGYGSAVAGVYPTLRRRLGSEPAAAVVFFAGCQAMALTLLPLLGGTPSPHRWRRDIMLSSLAHHVLYTAVVVAADRRATSRATSPGTPPAPR